MITFLKGLEIYDACFVRSSLLLRGACLFNICKNLSSNLVQDAILSVAKTYFNSLLNLTESFFLVALSNFLRFTFSDTSF